MCVDFREDIFIFFPLTALSLVMVGAGKEKRKLLEGIKHRCAAICFVVSLSEKIILMVDSVES